MNDLSTTGCVDGPGPGAWRGVDQVELSARTRVRGYAAQLGHHPPMDPDQ